ncbi:MAG: exonuclease domain-containing protein [Clostridia bacterium]|nr:exonuclease domain-containing protein [Clostridia bacterium]
MYNLIEFINKITKNKYHYLKLSDVSFNKSSNKLSLVLLYPDEVGVISEMDRIELMALINQYIDMDLEFEVRFVKSFYDDEYLKTLINNFNASEFPALCALVKTADLTTVEDAEITKINLKCLKGYISKEQLAKYNERLTNFLNNEFFHKFEVEILELDERLNSSLLENKKQEAIENSMSNVLPQKFVKVEIIEQIIGDDSSTTPLCVSSVILPETKISVVGTVKYLLEKEFIKKQKVMDSKEERYAKVKKNYYAFSLENNGKELNCVYFPNQLTEQKIKKLQDGMEVVLTGDVEAFNDKLSFKVKHITKVKILEKRKNSIKFKSVPKNYKVVFPEDYEVISQSNLFDDVEEPNDYLKNNTIVVFDLETTGLNHEDCQIVEIGAVKIENGKITKKFSTFVDPEAEIPLDATRIHGITDAMVMGAPKVDVALADFYKFCEGSTIVAYNIDFDYKFINYYGRKSGLNFNHPQKDALFMARQYIKGLKNYKLKTVTESMGILLNNAHRAYFDAAATAKVFIKLSENLK